MSQVLTELIEKACAKQGANRAQLAALLGVIPQRLNDWRSSLRSMPDDKVVELCQLAGVDPVPVVGTYHMERLRSR